MTSIELLSPARDLDSGIAAIDHGADAVYIGGPSFGARASACNTMGDIEMLARHAHRYRARVYLALNTILFDDELSMAEATAHRAWDAGVDALIVQDMGLLELDLPPLPLIASTQMHNMDVSHIRFLERVGFQRVILARELSLELIRSIRRETSIELEAFVHGSLCVSHSGRCYLSAALGGRSANRGACGQPCRLPWNLIDAQGHTIEHDRHLLSLKDMDRSAHIAPLIDAGITSFKIEGRLKDAAYVKNITAYYRTCIDAVLESRSDLKRSSGGKIEILFSPDPRKTFSRDSTSFFLHDEDDGVWSPDTSKSLGEEIGIVRQCGADWFSLHSGMAAVNSGDGLCFFDGARELRGMQVVRVTDDRIHVHRPAEGLAPRTAVFRNHDHLFLRGLSGRTARRKCGLSLVFRENPEGFVLEGRDEEGIEASVTLPIPKDTAEKPDEAVSTMQKQLSKLTDSMFFLSSLEIRTRPYFIRTAELNRLRRELLDAMEERRQRSYQRPLRLPVSGPAVLYPVTELDYSYNVSNRKAREFYSRHGVTRIEPAFELQKPCPGTVVMTTRHCIRRCLGACPRMKPYKKLSEPLFMENGDRRFQLDFDCRSCRMLVLIPKSA